MRAGSCGRTASTRSTPKSVRKKLKQPSFAAGVKRDEVYKGAEDLGVDLDEHIAFVIEAMRPIAPELGLRTSADVAAGLMSLDAFGVAVEDLDRDAGVLQASRSRRFPEDPEGHGHAEVELAGGIR